MGPPLRKQVLKLLAWIGGVKMNVGGTAPESRGMMRDGENVVRRPQNTHCTVPELADRELGSFIRMCLCLHHHRCSRYPLSASWP